MTHLTLPPGEYQRRLLRARAFLIGSMAKAETRAVEALASVKLAQRELASIDRQIAAANRGGAA